MTTDRTATSKQSARWNVGKTQPVTDAFQQGYGFSILNAHGAPLLTITYATETKSQQAEEAVRTAIAHAVSITAQPS